MVDKITRVLSSAASNPTRVETSLSLAEPESAWVAHRQSAINADNQRRGRDEGAVNERTSPAEPGADGEVDGDGSGPAPNEEENAERLSGESDRIGSGNLDDDVPFGQHLGYV